MFGTVVDENKGPKPHKRGMGVTPPPESGGVGLSAAIPPSSGSFLLGRNFRFDP
jgi:hypothetical protein